MEILARLYEISTDFIEGTSPWSDLAEKVRDLTESEFTLYTVNVMGTDPEDLSPKIITSTQTEKYQEYIDQKLFLEHVVPEGELSHFVPQKSGDIFDHLITREAFGETRLGAFYEASGVHNFMIVPAFLTSGLFLGAFLHRHRDLPDFDDMDLQRFTIWMRFIAQHFENSGTLLAPQPSIFEDYVADIGLTETETQIFTLLLKGHSIREISSLRNISYGTARWHAQNILSKSGSASQKELVARFYTMLIPNV